MNSKPRLTWAQYLEDEDARKEAEEREALVQGYIRLAEHLAGNEALPIHPDVLRELLWD